MDIIFHWVGVAVCCAAGLFATGFFIGFCLNYLFQKLKEIHGFDKIYKLLREDAKRSNI